jgi:hypothetical protein
MGQKRTLFIVPLYVCSTPESGHLSDCARGENLLVHALNDSPFIIIEVEITTRMRSATSVWMSALGVGWPFRFA